ncbi:Di- and tricarboxylate transporter [Tistlia consotensis]|uniref:Di-and tricarboxylate transporter n=1 Tax=Tistlia consotensis USBA 355 TaxID=560819 RepID=A0A1Y6BXG5_9PROT|nr:SLC13 family permease [Tistlia consotensis]SMF32487.1 Di-and tricarboxylate transporter [Tistlia consotensis USBA 355]SNR68540.1 Di- and tricarboxylate transporter [Tistlia consotensis]
MTTEQILLFAILGAALLLFAWGRLRYDLVAMLALLVAVVAGIVPADHAFDGFGHPAVITVAAILILSRALRNSSLVDLAARLLGSLGHRPSIQVLGLALVTAIFSAFMNNVGALALMLPVALAVAAEAKRPASEVLMPISFASLLGGLTTLIGTPPNIVIASFRAGEAGQPFGMFDFAPVGLSIALVGVVFVALVGWHLLPKRQEQQTGQRPLVAIEDYVTEVRLPAKSAYVGRRLVDIETLGQADLSVVALVRNDDRILAPSGFIRLQAGDILILEADAEALQLVLDKAELELVGAADISAGDLRSDRVGLVEAVIVPGSRMEGRTARSMRLHTRFGLNLLAFARQGEEQHERLGQVRFAAGDVLLLQGEREALPDVLAALGCLPLAGRDLQLRRRGGSPWSPLIFLIAIGTVVAGLLPPQIAFLGAAIGTLAVGDVHLRELYESIEWPVIVLLGAMIPVGMALESTGGSQTVAVPLLHLGGHAPAWVVLGLLMVVTMLLSDIMNNAATAVLMAPIGITVAHGLGASVDPFLMAVAIGSSSTYLTPIGHQSNLLVMGPGGYRFSDYWRMGLPLDLLILLVGLPMILLIWPL